MTASSMTYADYLALDTVLDAQTPLSDAHDEMLFIIQHQTSELWMRLAIHELVSAHTALADSRLHHAFKMLARVARIFEQLNGAWDVLRTMTPSEYTQFRDALGQSSGFQSYQYREIEFLLGNRNPALLKQHQNNPKAHARLEAALHQPSLYDTALQRVHQAGLPIAAEHLARDVTATYRAHESVTDAWQAVYEDTEQYWDLYQLGEKLVDLEDYFRRWRFNHVTTVERVIGLKPGTGGTSGVSYLRKMLEVVLFPELWSVRTRL